MLLCVSAKCQQFQYLPVWNHYNQLKVSITTLRELSSITVKKVNWRYQYRELKLVSHIAMTSVIEIMQVGDNIRYNIQHSLNDYIHLTITCDTWYSNSLYEPRLSMCGNNENSNGGLVASTATDREVEPRRTLYI